MQRMNEIEEQQIVASTNSGFRATMADVQHSDGSCILTEETAKLLNAQVGDPIYVLDMYPEKR